MKYNKNPASNLSLPINSALLEDNMFVGFVQGKRLNKKDDSSNENNNEVLLSSSFKLKAKDVNSEIDTVSVSIERGVNENEAVIGAGLTPKIETKLDILQNAINELYLETIPVSETSGNLDLSSLDDAVYSTEDPTEGGWFSNMLPELPQRRGVKTRDNSLVETWKAAIKEQLHDLLVKKGDAIRYWKLGEHDRNTINNNVNSIFHAHDNFQENEEIVSPTINDGTDCSNKRKCCLEAQNIFSCIEMARNGINEVKSYSYIGNFIDNAIFRDYCVYAYFAGFERNRTALHAPGRFEEGRSILFGILEELEKISDDEDFP